MNCDIWSAVTSIYDPHYRGVGREGSGGGGGGGGVRQLPLFEGKFYTFPILSVRGEVSAKTTFLKSSI